MKVRLVFNGKVLEERLFDRVPFAGELIWISSDELYIVQEVFWRQDGHASIMVSNHMKREYEKE